MNGGVIGVTTITFWSRIPAMLILFFAKGTALIKAEPLAFMHTIQ
jgi:hypothetical protein